MIDQLIEWIENLEPWQMLAVTVGAALVVHVFLGLLLPKLTRKSGTEIDDRIIAALRKPIFFTIILVGVHFTVLRAIGTDWYAADRERLRFIVRGLLFTIGIWYWARGVARTFDAILEAMARRADDFAWIEMRSLPLYEIMAKLLVLGTAIYGIMAAWQIDVTAWLASAGILGIAVGFAAKDTLANLFAGIFILTDAPYKLGDYIVMESGERGKVTDIGIRSTRILTRDDIEITIPNSVMANTKIVNESAGRHLKRRIRTSVGVAYGSDLARVREVLAEAAAACPYASSSPEPRVRFPTRGDSALVFQVLIWVDNPELRGRATDSLNGEIHDRVLAAGIEIPFPQRVVHLQQPSEA